MSKQTITPATAKALRVIRDNRIVNARQFTWLMWDQPNRRSGIGGKIISDLIRRGLVKDFGVVILTDAGRDALRDFEGPASA